jgi:hypothetical protein
MRVGSSYETTFATLLACLLGACSSTDDQSAADASDDGLVVGQGNDASSPFDAPYDATTPGVVVRIAQLSPDLGAIDLCYRPTGTTSWTGPIFATLHPPLDAGPVNDGGGGAGGGDAGGGDAGPEDAAASYDASAMDAGAPYDAGAPIGVAFESVSTYVALAGSGTFDVAVVASGSVSCATPEALDRVTLTPAEQATLVVMGSAALDASAADALQVLAFEDDSSVDPTSARLRFIHAGLGTSASPAIPAVSVALVFSDQTSVAVAADVEPGQAASASSTPPVVDSLGYTTLSAASAPASIVLRTSDDAGAAMWLTSAAPLALTTSSLHTAFIYDAARSVAVLYCEDLSVGGGSTSSPCTVLAAE